jgi:hypothetical protein
MMDKKVTTIVTRTATDGSAVQVAFVAGDGTSTQVMLTRDALRDAISALIEAGTVVPQDYSREEGPAIDDHPIRPLAMSISPISDEPNNARLTLVCGLVDLQFAVSIEALFQVLQTLKDESEPDPISSRLN